MADHDDGQCDGDWALHLNSRKKRMTSKDGKIFFLQKKNRCTFRAFFRHHPILIRRAVNFLW